MATNSLLTRESDAVIPPSSLFVFWPGEQTPLAEEIRLRLQAWGHPAHDHEDFALQGDMDFGGAAAEGTLWAFRFELADRPVSYLVWCEEVNGLHRQLLGSVRWRTLDQEAEAHACRWVVGLEGPLSLRQPTADYQMQLRLCDAISAAGSPVIYDANAFLFRTLQDLHHLTVARTPPRIGCLYTVHKVPDDSGEDMYWLHTHGLERAGVPELELFGVPGKLLHAGCELMEAVAGLWIEYQTPEPDAPFEIGDSLRLMWRPWQAAVTELRGNAVGGWAYRREGQGHTGYRAVLTIAPKTPRNGRLGPPLDVLEALTRAETTLFKTVSETRRMAQLARERWGTFGMLFASKRPSQWRFAVKLSYPAGNSELAPEHLWFDVLEIKPGRIQAKLVSVPATVTGLEVGNAAWHLLEQLSDWRIVTEDSVYDPETAAVLLEDD